VHSGQVGGIEIGRVLGEQYLVLKDRRKQAVLAAEVGVDHPLVGPGALRDRACLR
jgi:hypothetical protein